LETIAHINMAASRSGPTMSIKIQPVPDISFFLWVSRNNAGPHDVDPNAGSSGPKAAANSLG
jgi:hypothetical protein